MAVLHSLLAMYGALDQVASQTTDPQMRAAVEKLLPGTTAPDQRGWFAQIQNFVTASAREQALENGTDVAAAEEAAKFPDAEKAAEEIRAAAGTDAMSHRLTQRAVYAGMGILALTKLKNDLSISVPVLDNLTLDNVTALSTLATAPVPRSDPADSGSSSDSDSGSDSANDSGGSLPPTLDVLIERGADGWNQSMGDLAADKTRAIGLSPEARAIPTIKALGESIGPAVTHEITDADGTSTVTDNGKVTSEVIQIDGELCALLTTEFSRTPYDIEKVLAVVEPPNWDNANKFFAKMQPKGLAADNRSSQILEEVSTHPDIYRIKTNLKYVNEDRPDGTYVINYDFADTRGDDDSHQVKVDSGYICVGPSTDGAGVRVLTSKMVAIDGLSPTAVAVFAHAMGWLSIGEMMMFGEPTDDPSDPLEKWTESPDRNVLVKPAGNRTAQATQPAQEQIQPVSRLFVKEATAAMADYLNIATSETAVVADKWLKGELTLGDVVEHTTTLGGRLASEPFRLLQKMMNNAVGPASQKPSTGKAKGDGSQ